MILEEKIVKNILCDLQIPGKYSVNWDGKNNNGIAVSSEIDFYEIQNKIPSSKKKDAITEIIDNIMIR